MDRTTEGVPPLFLHRAYMYWYMSIDECSPSIKPLGGAVTSSIEGIDSFLYARGWAVPVVMTIERPSSVTGSILEAVNTPSHLRVSASVAISPLYSEHIDSRALSMLLSAPDITSVLNSSMV